MVELNLEHVLILAVAVFLLYHFVGRCNCFNGNGFSVGGLDCKDQWGNHFEGDCNVKEMSWCTDDIQCQGCRKCSKSNFCQGESSCPT